MKKIRVLMVAGSMHVGGIENQLMHLVRKSDPERFQFDFTSDNPNAFYREEIEQLGGRFLLIPKMNWRRPLPYCKAMYRIMKRGHYDIVHSHELFHSGITLFLAMLAGIPCRFVHAHNWQDGDGTNRRRGLIRTIYNAVMRWLIDLYSTTQIACSSWAGRFLYGEKQINKPSYHVVYNSVDTKEFLKCQSEEKSDSKKTNKWSTVLNVARISEVKNQLFLIEIAKVLKMRGHRIQFLCAGDGDRQIVSTIQMRIQEYGLGKYIQLLGVRKDIDVLMHQADAFILPSRYEGMPLVMIEAQASGLPCLSADTYSHEVDFGTGQIEWMSLDEGAEKWADAVEKLVTKPRASLESVKQAIDEKGFDSERFAEIICSLYEEDVRRRGKYHD